MRFLTVVHPIACLAVGALVMPTAARADDAREIATAAKWAQKVTGRSCDAVARKRGKDTGGSHLYRIRYRHPGQDQDSPDQLFELFQLPCTHSDYAASFVYVAREDGAYRILAFAEPKLDYDYTDESFSALKAPPKVAGYLTTSTLAEAVFDPKTNSISMTAKWRKEGDAWSTGLWQFDDAQFVLKRYDVDPTYEGTLDDKAGKAPASKESYQVFPIVQRNQ